MEILDKEIQQYSERNTSTETELLRKINRETYANVLGPRMMSGHLQGRLLAMISRMVQPKNILEVGTFTGYSTICLAEGLAPGGKLVTLDINEELEERVRGYFEEAKLENVINYRIGNALQTIPTLNDFFDLVFIDADKENYSNYFDLIIDKVPAGGFILADNVLWNGKILDADPDRDTRAVLDFNNKVHHDSRVENILLPIRDGMMVMRRI